MKILLTAAPFWNEPDAPAPRHIRSCAPMAPYLLAAILAEKGYEAEVLDPSALDSMIDDESFVARLLQYDIVGVSSTSGAWPNALKILKPFAAMKDRPTIILGGPHPSAFPEYILKSISADYVVMGEADETIIELVSALADGEKAVAVAGAVWRDGDKAVVNDTRGPLSPERLGDLPVPTFEGLPGGYYDVIPVETSRGCPHQCVFCSVKFGGGLRQMSPEAAAKRVALTASKLGLSVKKALFSVDDCFTAGVERAEAVADVAARGNIPMAIEARVVDLLDDNVFRVARKIDPVKIEVGVESGYPEGLKRVGKGLTIERVVECAEKLREAGLAGRTRFSFVMGLPWEGRREVTDTMKFAAKLAARSGAHIQLNWFTCYPKSPAHRDAARWGIDISPEDYDRPFWWKAPDIFRRAHPKLSEKDALDALEYLRLLKRARPGITFEGLLGV